MKSILALGAVFLGLVFSTGAPMADSFALAGRYDVLGASADNQPYQGEVTIAPLGKAWQLSWSFGGGVTHTGIGLREGKLLGAAYSEAGKSVGIVLYHIEGQSLHGVWSLGENGGLGQEILRGSDSLTGTYEIATGRNPDGTPYGGSVTITRRGEAYLFDWSSEADGAMGIGLKHGDWLVVAYSHDERPGIVLYGITKPADGPLRLTGYWTNEGAGGLGKEALRKRP